NEWEQELYRMAVPASIEVLFASVAEGIRHLGEWHRDRRRTALLTGEIKAMAALHAADPDALHRINLGGLHHQPGRSERLPYLYLTDTELTQLDELVAAGADVSAQDVPTAQRTAVEALR